jgi:hypothetical protein
MERFYKILKQRDRALAVFSAARDQLLAVTEQLEIAVKQCDENMLNLEAQIAEEKKAKLFAHNEISSAQGKLQKFDGLLS